MQIGRDPVLGRQFGAAGKCLSKFAFEQTKKWPKSTSPPVQSAARPTDDDDYCAAAAADDDDDDYST